jgi:hypothetical protein
LDFGIARPLYRQRPDLGSDSFAIIGRRVLFSGQPPFALTLGSVGKGAAVEREHGAAPRVITSHRASWRCFFALYGHDYAAGFLGQCATTALHFSVVLIFFPFRTLLASNQMVFAAPSVWAKLPNHFVARLRYAINLAARDGAGAPVADRQAFNAHPPSSDVLKLVKRTVSPSMIWS